MDRKHKGKLLTIHGNHITMSHDDGTHEDKHDVLANASIKLNGEKVHLVDLLVGDAIEINGDPVSNIVATRGDDAKNGTLLVVVGNHITMAHDDGSHDDNHNVQPDAVITLDGNKARLEDLLHGDAIEIHGNPVTSIVATRHGGFEAKHDHLDAKYDGLDAKYDGEDPFKPLFDK